MYKKYVLYLFTVCCFSLTACGNNADPEYTGEPTRLRAAVAIDTAYSICSAEDKNAYYRDGCKEGLLRATKYFPLANNFYTSKFACEEALLELDREKAKNAVIEWCQDTWSVTVDSQKGCIAAAELFYSQITPNMCVSALR